MVSSRCGEEMVKRADTRNCGVDSATYVGSPSDSGHLGADSGEEEEYTNIVPLGGGERADLSSEPPWLTAPFQRQAINKIVRQHDC